MALVRLSECASLAAPSPYSDLISDFSLSEVSFDLEDLTWQSADNYCVNNNSYKLENEVMVDPWSSMDSNNSPLTDSGPSASDDCTPSTSSEPPRDIRNYETRCNPEPAGSKASGSTRGKEPTKTDKARPRNLPLDLDHTTRRLHFLDEDYQSPTRSNIECRILKPHFLDSPSPDEFDERSDITNPNFLDDESNDDHKKAGALPKRPQKVENRDMSTPEERPHRTNFRSTLHYGLENAARSSERDKRTSQLYQGTWPGEREVWAGHDTASVRSFSSNGSTDATRPSSNLENKMECVYNLLSLLTLSPDNNADLSGPLLEMSRSVESCIAMRQAGCIPLLVQLIHSKLARETRDRAAKALRNIIHTQTDDKAGRREARVWRLLEQVREYCYILEDLVESRKENKDTLEDDVNKHPSQCVAALMKLSFDEEHRHVVCHLGGLQALAALVSGDQAAHGSRTDDITCLTMRRYAGMTLTNLTFGDGNNKSLLCSFKDFMMALVEQLESPNDDMLQVTAAVLRNLSWRADTNSKQILREVGAVKGLTIAAMTCQKETTLKSVLSALWNLTAHCSMNKVALCSVEGALGFLVDMLSYNSPSKTLAIIENAGGIMRNVSSHIAVREDYRQILRERNCLGVLLQHLKSPSLTVVSNSCGTLWNLSARCPQDQQFLWDHGAVPMLRSLIHSKHKMIAMGSSAALKNLLNSKPGKSHIISLDSTARNMNLPALPTLGVRKQKALEQELDQNLAETCDNIEPATSPSTSNREEKNLYSATERQIAMNLERHRMTSSSPLMGALQSQISLSHSAHMAGYLSCSNTLLKGALVSRSNNGSSNNVNRSDSKDSVTSTHSDSVFERATRTGKVPIPTPRTKDLVKSDPATEVFNVPSEPKENTFKKYPTQPPVPTPRSTADLRTNYTESGYDVDQDTCDQPIDYSQKYSETKANANGPAEEKTEVRVTAEPKKYAKKGTFGDYQETDLDQPTDYSLRYAEHQSEVGSDSSEPPAPSVNEDTIKHFCTEGTPYETPIIFSTATSMSDLRVIGPKEKPKQAVKENPEIMTHSDEKDTCSIEETPRHDNDKGAPVQTATPKVAEKTVFDTKFSSGMISPEKPVNYCEEGTPGYFSRVSSLSSLGDPSEQQELAKKNAMATINATVVDDEATNTVKDKEGSKAVTFACEPSETPPEPSQPPFEEQANNNESGFVLETPLMFSRSSSMGSMAENQDEVVSVVSVVSEISRLTSCCVSPSDIPDSPAHSVIHSPARSITAPSTPPQPEHGTVFEERVSQFIVENTPAHFSTATSLSELTIPDDKSLLEQLDETCELDDNITTQSDTRHHYEDREASIHENPMCDEPLPCAVPKNETKVTLPNDSCRIYHTEDTPAIFSNLGSNSNLSALSVESGPTLAPVHDTSDSSNLSDSADLLEQCIQKGIDRVVKNKGQSSESSSAAGIKPVLPRDEVYHSLPPYLRSSTETIRLPHEATRLVHDKSSSVSPPPPLPPKSSSAVAPPRPPNSQLHTLGRKHESRLPVKSQRNTKERPKQHSNLARNDSLSSLSLDSFGSTDREIFEETVKAGLSSVNPRANYALESKEKSHSVERPIDNTRHNARIHKSLDRSDKISQHKTKVRDVEFERNLASGAYNVKSSSRFKKYDNDCMTRSPYSYHGDTAAHSLSHHSRWSKHSRFHDDGPPSLPARIDARLERSNSLSSLSNDSFGSTDKEVFERIVRVGMSKPNHKKGKNEEKLRVRSDDRLEAREHRSRRRRTEPIKPLPPLGALDKMLGEEYSKDRAILEEMIAKGAGEKPNAQSKNVPAPSVARASADGNADLAPNTTIGFNVASTDTKQSPVTHSDSNTMFESAAENEMDQSNEFLAPKSNNTTLESIKDELDRSNESYADVLDGLSDIGSLHKNDTGTIKRQNKNNLEWTSINVPTKPFDVDDESSKKADDTWNDNTCPDDVTFPTISGSVHMIASIQSEIADPTSALPDLLETSDIASVGPDLTNRLFDDHLSNASISEMKTSGHGTSTFLDSIPEPSFTSLLEDSEPKYNSLMSSAIEKEAARLAAQLKASQYTMDTSVTSITSLDLNNVKPPSDLGSLISLSTSGQWDESASQVSKKSQKSRKKSLPVAFMVKRALSNSMHLGSSEHLDSNPASFLDNVKPPSEMDQIDLEGSMISVSSIGSEVVEREKTPVVFDLKQPIQDFPLCNNFTMLQDLNKVNPPSLFEEICESTVEMEPTTAQQMYDDCISNTLNVVTDIPSGSENCTPIPSDMSSVESTPKRKCLTPKERRQVAKDRYQTYTITDSVTENTDVVLEVDSEDFLTWTKSESDSRSDDYVTATSEPKTKRKLSAKQRRQEDRARYQTQTVNIGMILAANSTDPKVEALKQRLDAKRTIKQRRLEDAERYKTRTLSEDIPPSPTFIIKDVNLENVETTTGYDSLSSNELNHHIDESRQINSGRDIDSGHNEDDYEINSTPMNEYTNSYRNYLPVVESSSVADLCIVNNLKNIEMTASYQRALQHRNNPSTSDFASFEGESDHSDSDIETPVVKAKPKIIKPEDRRDESLDSNESLDKDGPKGIRGRKKGLYVSPYRRNVTTKTSEATTSKPAATTSRTMAQVKKAPVKTAVKSLSNNTSPKKTVPIKTIQKPSVVKPLPLERQGTFTKEATVARADLPVADTKMAKATKTIPKVNTSPSRLPQPSSSKFGLTKPVNKKVADKAQVKKPNRSSYPSMKNSASNHSLQSNDSGKTVTLASRTTSRQGSTSSINSMTSKNNVESKIANLWRKVEQSKKQPSKPDKRVWIGAEPETPKLIRSSTFESPPKFPQPAAPKQKSSIAIRSSGIPSLRPKSSPTKLVSQLPKKPATTRSAFTRKPVNGQS